MSQKFSGMGQVLKIGLGFFFELHSLKNFKMCLSVNIWRDQAQDELFYTKKPEPNPWAQGTAHSITRVPLCPDSNQGIHERML
jgi:hypothetical protein